MSTIMGIDPGASGGIAYRFAGGRVLSIPMPTDMHEVVELLCNLNVDRDLVVVMEKVHAMPNDGKGSIAKFMTNYGILLGILMALGIRRIDVSPQKWMSSYGMKKAKDETKTSWKNRLKSKAKDLYPDQKITLKTADAILIMEYGRKIGEDT